MLNTHNQRQFSTIVGNAQNRHNKKYNMTDIKDTKAYSINDFINWYEANELTLSPKYQRNAVWNYNAKSYLIDTIIRGFPIPQIFLRQTIDTNTRKTTREIIDGQQRLRAIIEFVENRFPIMASHNLEYGKKFYNDLNEETREKILNYNIGVEIIKLKEDSKIYEMFARLNTNNMALNKQELRNAQFTGEFKVFIYRKSSQYKDFLIAKGTFKDKELTRMLDVEYFNSLVIHLIDGIVNDTSIKFDNYYKKFDKEFNIAENVEFKLDKIFEILIHIFENRIFETKLFQRKNYLFTLFCTLNFQIFEISHPDIQLNNRYNLANIEKNILDLINSIMKFEGELFHTLSEKEYLDDNDIKIYLNFDKFHKTRTTSVVERTERIKILTAKIIE